ncbi:MAG: hypothetical protein HOI95_14355 [Chromatiales bacterium]|nr:hypothetical protein [Chromatiales bacterium]
MAWRSALACVLLLAISGVWRGASANTWGFERIDANSPFIIAAPHGGYDLHTETIVKNACGRLAWNCLIAQGFRTREVPLNVNRPTEGVDVPMRKERHTDRAAAVYTQ